eukprot:3098173-Prymnesium_polylepis.2
MRSDGAREIKAAGRTAAVHVQPMCGHGSAEARQELRTIARTKRGCAEPSGPSKRDSQTEANAYHVRSEAPHNNGTTSHGSTAP